MPAAWIWSGGYWKKPAALPGPKAKMSGAVAGCRRAAGWPAPQAGAAGPVRVPMRATRSRCRRATSDLAKKQGWTPRVAEGAVFGRWATVVGSDISEHASPTGLRDGVLSVTAESTAWATQLRLIQKQVLAKIAAEVGDGVVTSLRITGPTAPSWRKGPRHISGRGPRDTYG